ncbi:transposase (fragment) [Syntrophaceticus schinkii]|uniref:Transposase n=1 Tax=Syntrophaceticus schinkii TaxID=499207 RepID=A0A0B7MJN9_9FIRM
MALLTTDTELPDEEVVRIYGKRWSIEVFFKMSKSYLKLAKEFQGRSYDSMVASTAIVFIGYIMLSLESRNGEDLRTIGQLFYICCDELKDISLAEALQKLLTLLERFLGEQLQLAEQEIRRLIDYLIGNLPSFFKERLAICCCES